MSPIVGAPPIKPKATFFIIFVIIVAAVTAVGCLCVKRQRFLEYKNSKTPLPAGFTYTAHTGCMDTDDNSLESIEKGAEYGADIVEFDLNFTADNTPVLCHDEPKGGEVTLEEAFKKLGSRVVKNHEILENSLRVTEYQNGSKAVINLTDKEIDSKYGKVEAKSYLIVAE